MRDEGADVGHVLDDLEADDGIEGLAGRMQLLDARRPIVDGETLGLGVPACDRDRLRRRIDAGHAGAEPGERLRDEAAAAADVEDRQALRAASASLRRRARSGATSASRMKRSRAGPCWCSGRNLPLGSHHSPASRSKRSTSRGSRVASAGAETAGSAFHGREDTGGREQQIVKARILRADLRGADAVMRTGRKRDFCSP